METKSIEQMPKEELITLVHDLNKEISSMKESLKIRAEMCFKTEKDLTASNNKLKVLKDIIKVL